MSGPPLAPRMEVRDVAPWSSAPPAMGPTASAVRASQKTDHEGPSDFPPAIARSSRRLCFLSTNVLLADARTGCVATRTPRPILVRTSEPVRQVASQTPGEVPDAARTGSSRTTPTSLPATLARLSSFRCWSPTSNGARTERRTDGALAGATAPDTTAYHSPCDSVASTRSVTSADPSPKTSAVRLAIATARSVEESSVTVPADAGTSGSTFVGYATVAARSRPAPMPIKTTVNTAPHVTDRRGGWGEELAPMPANCG